MAPVVEPKNVWPATRDVGSSQQMQTAAKTVSFGVKPEMNFFMEDPLLRFRSGRTLHNRRDLGENIRRDAKTAVTRCDIPACHACTPARELDLSGAWSILDHENFSHSVVPYSDRRLRSGCP